MHDSTRQAGFGEGGNPPPHVFFCPSPQSRWICFPADLPSRAADTSHCPHIFPSPPCRSLLFSLQGLEKHRPAILLLSNQCVWPVLPSEVPSMKYTHVLQGGEIRLTSLTSSLASHHLHQRDLRSQGRGSPLQRVSVYRDSPEPSAALEPFPASQEAACSLLCLLALAAEEGVVAGIKRGTKLWWLKEICGGQPDEGPGAMSRACSFPLPSPVRSEGWLAPQKS